MRTRTRTRTRLYRTRRSILAIRKRWEDGYCGHRRLRLWHFVFPGATWTISWHSRADNGVLKIANRQICCLESMKWKTFKRITTQCNRDAPHHGHYTAPAFYIFFCPCLLLKFHKSSVLGLCNLVDGTSGWLRLCHQILIQSSCAPRVLVDGRRPKNCPREIVSVLCSNPLIRALDY